MNTSKIVVRLAASLLSAFLLTTNSWSAAAASAPLKLRWELLRNEPGGTAGRLRGVARFTITSQDKLPASGWAIYFNVMDGVQPQTLANGLVIEPVSGQLIRLRPGPGFAGLQAGASVQADYHYPSPVLKSFKIPAGPYLAFDDRPEAAAAITDYVAAPVAGRAGPLTPEELYARNAAVADIAPDALPPVLPTPQQFARGQGVLRLDSMPRIDAPSALRNEAGAVAAMLEAYLPRASAANSARPVTRLALRVGKVPGTGSPEAYKLSIDPARGIALQGTTAAGVFRGLQSLRQMLPLAAQGGTLTLPALQITDAPRFAYRGFMLDVSRNFQDKETVFRTLDLMARYKLNKFHFHLTDDEGWRLAIAGLPELTDFGARRGHTLTVKEHLQPAYGSGPGVSDRHGSGFYTRADYIDILRYAKARHIDVIPEIEMPGHARAAVKAMTQRYHRLLASDPAAARRYLLEDFDDRSVYKSAQEYNDNVINPGLESSYTFIDHVVADVVAMHKEAGVPLVRLHVGGDELAAGAWEKSPASQQLKLGSAAALWDHFYNRVHNILAKHGLKAFGWEELATHAVAKGGVTRQEPNPEFVKRDIKVVVWNNLGSSDDLAYRLANAGYGTVLAPATHLYLDMAHNHNPEEPGMEWAEFSGLDKVFAYNPYDYLKDRTTDPARRAAQARLTEAGRRNILGIEAALFTELVRDRDLMDYMLMPRLLAMAERAWAPEPKWAREPDDARAAQLRQQDWSVFVNQLGKRVLPALDAERSGIAYRIAPPGLRVEQGSVLANHQLPGFALHYTVDGSAPSPGSPRVMGPIKASGKVRVAAVAANGRVGLVSEVQPRP